MKFPGVDATNFSTKTRSLQLYSHGLHKSRPRHHPWHILRHLGLHFRDHSPIHPIDYRCRTHQCISKIPASPWFLSTAQWLLAEHREAFQSRPLHSVGSFRTQAASLYPMCHSRIHPLSGSCGLAFPFLRLLRRGLYGRKLKYKSHHTLPCLEGSLAAFFYDAFAKLGGHLLNIAAVQIQFFGNLFVGQIQPHEIEAQYPCFERLMMSGKNGVRKVIEAFLTIFALVALPVRLLFIEASSDDSSGVTNRTLPAFWPTQFSHGVVSLSVIHLVFYIYLHLLDSFHGSIKIGPFFITTCPRIQHKPFAKYRCRASAEKFAIYPVFDNVMPFIAMLLEQVNILQPE